MFKCFLQYDGDPVCYGVGLTARGAVKAGVRAWCLKNDVIYATRDHYTILERMVSAGYLLSVGYEA